MKAYGPQRLAYIPYEKRGKFIKPNPGVLLGVLIFVGAIFLPGYTKLGQLFAWYGMWICIAVGGLLFGILSLAWQARWDRRKWKRIRARHIDHEVWQDFSNDSDGGKVWNFLILCEYELDGKTYRVTPGYWCSFPMKGSVLRFVSKRIAADGTCEIYINPDNPLQTEIVGHDIKDFLLHWPRK